MSLFIILTVIQAVIAAGLVAVVLMQRSEGGGLGIGGNPSGALGARGAADFMTRATKWLAVGFVVLSILLAAMAVADSGDGEVTSTLDRDVSAPAAPAGQSGADLLGEGAGQGGSAAPAAGETPAASDDPLAE